MHVMECDIVVIGKEHTIIVTLSKFFLSNKNGSEMYSAENFTLRMCVYSLVFECRGNGIRSRQVN